MTPLGIALSTHYAVRGLACGGIARRFESLYHLAMSRLSITSRTAWPLMAGLALLFPLASACGSDDSEDDARLQVIATIAPVEALVREVAGDLAAVEVIAGPGVDPHDFELAPADRRLLDDGDLVVQIGLGIDRFADDVEEDRLLTLSEGLALRAGGHTHDEGEEHEDEEEHDEDEDDHSHEDEEFDPHVWHSPENDRRMATAIAERLAALDPENSGAYFDNAAAFIARLDEADATIRTLIDAIPAQNRKIVTNHDSIGYFIDYYGLEFVGAVIPAQTTSAEPSAADIADLIELIRSEGVKAIFAESSVDPKVAQQVADETGVAIVDDLYADSLGEEGSGAETMDGMLLANARKIAAALED
jgi:zinc/manganese transport system substrate-binding protein